MFFKRAECGLETKGRRGKKEETKPNKGNQFLNSSLLGHRLVSHQQTNGFISASHFGFHGAGEINVRRKLLGGKTLPSHSWAVITFHGTIPLSYCNASRRLDYGLGYGRFSLLAHFVTTLNPTFLFPAVKFCFGWSWKHPNARAVFRYVLEVLSSLWSMKSS
jgi:hypothetical protein